METCSPLLELSSSPVLLKQSTSSHTSKFFYIKPLNMDVVFSHIYFFRQLQHRVQKKITFLKSLAVHKTLPREKEYRYIFLGEASPHDTSVSAKVLGPKEIN